MTDLLQPRVAAAPLSATGPGDGERSNGDAIGVAIAVTLAAVYGRIGDATTLLGSEGTIAQILSVTVAAALFGHIITGRADPGPWRLALVVLGTLFGLIIGSVAYAENTSNTIEDALDVAKSALVLLIIVAGVTNAGRLRLATWGIVAATSFVSLINIFQQLTRTFGTDYWELATSEAEAITSSTLDYRSAGPSLGPNGFALMLIFALPLAIDRARGEERRNLRITAMVSTAIIVVALLFTYSRNGFLNLMLAGAMLVYFYRIRLLYAFLSVLVFAAAITVASPDAFLDRIATLTEFVDGTSDSGDSLSSGRQSEYIVAVQMFADHPVAGVGFGNYPHHYLSYSTELGLDDRREDRGAHSLYLQFASELGIFGILWLATAAVVLFRRLNGARARLAAAGRGVESDQLAAYLMAFTLFLSFSMLRHLSIPRYFMVALAFAIAAPYALERRS